MFKKILSILVVSVIFITVSTLATPVFGLQKVRVTWQKGEVSIGLSQEGPWKTLKSSVPVTAGSFIKTGKNSMVELTMPDNSIIRLASNTLFELNQAFFPEDKPRRFYYKLFIGKMWAKVTSAFRGRRGTFNTSTYTAVAGVRGTTYNLKAKADKSTEISVYEGKVGVGPPLIVEGGQKEEMAWPMQVSEKKWEEIILGKLQKLYIGPDGKPGKPISFDPSKEKDEWVMWNQERDALR
ncbi:MAG: FecR domain-containing protein [Deltaproteobacteria bacterium]|nr:FecR domain-containing protein [Deltaproteobacteria bacterium]